MGHLLIPNDYYTDQFQENLFIKQLAQIRNNEKKEISFARYESVNGRAERIIEALGQNQSVTDFNISYIDLSSDEIKLIVSFLEKKKNINKITLDSRCCLNENELENFTILAKLLGSQITFNIFESSVWSKIGLHGAKILAPNLINNNFLKELNLICSEITDDGAKMILEALAPSQAIKQIILNASKLNDQAALYIKSFLINNQSLQKLDLSGNEITNAGLEQIKQGLFINQSLTELSLSNNKLDIKAEDFYLLKQIITFSLKINNYIKNIISNNLTNNVADNNEYMLKELENAAKLKTYLSNQALFAYLQDLDYRFKYDALGISPVPLKIILKSGKFLPFINSYLFKCLEKTFEDQDEAIEKTLELLASDDLHDQKYSQEFAKQISANDNFSSEEKQAITFYQEHRDCINDLYINRADVKSGVELFVKFMEKNSEEAIQIQQFEKIFHIFREFDIITQSIDHYEKTGGYVISEAGNYKYDYDFSIVCQRSEVLGESNAHFG